jgi:hypothetical protein
VEAETNPPSVNKVKKTSRPSDEGEAVVKKPKRTSSGTQISESGSSKGRHDRTETTTKRTEDRRGALDNLLKRKQDAAVGPHSPTRRSLGGSESSKLHRTSTDSGSTGQKSHTRLNVTGQRVPTTSAPSGIHSVSSASRDQNLNKKRRFGGSEESPPLRVNVPGDPNLVPYDVTLPLDASLPPPATLTEIKDSKTTTRLRDVGDGMAFLNFAQARGWQEPYSIKVERDRGTVARLFLGTARTPRIEVRTSQPSERSDDAEFYALLVLVRDTLAEHPDAYKIYRETHPADSLPSISARLASANTFEKACADLVKAFEVGGGANKEGWGPWASEEGLKPGEVVQPLKKVMSVSGVLLSLPPCERCGESSN